MENVIFLQPHFTHNVWGGTRLRKDFGYNVPGSDIGECWGIAAHPNGESTVVGGEFDGMRLSELYETHRELFGNCRSRQFPLLVKIIDANDDLSIQVHPSDLYAIEHENGSCGKTECWYIIDCPDNASLVVGHNASSRDEMKKMIEQGRWDEFLRKLPIKKGDFIQINPGTVHAITAGCLILETQQNSDITYRVYDYERLTDGKPRPLHIRKSMEVITVPDYPVGVGIVHGKTPGKSERLRLIENNYYKVFRLNVAEELIFTPDPPFTNMSVIEGQGKINGTNVHKGAHFIVTAGCERVELTGNMLIIASVPVQ